MLKEVYAALNADSRTLAMMGARALIDIVMVQEVGDEGSFEKKLRKLQDDGFLSAKNAEVLDAALEVGNALPVHDTPRTFSRAIARDISAEGVLP